MALKAPVRLARDQVQALLSDQTQGFNATLASICADEGITPFTIDFASPNSLSFFKGQVSISDIVESSPKVSNVLCLYGLKSTNTNQQKFSTFSGVVYVGIDVHLNFRRGRADQDFEAISDAVQAAIITIMNKQTADPWVGGVTYNGGVEILPLAVAFGGENWQKTIRFVLTFEVDEL